MSEDEDRRRSRTGRLGAGGWLGLIVLFAFLGWAIWYAVHAWQLVGGVGISPAGWVFLVLGVVVTTVVGAGLMGLLFYSSRKGRDF